MKIKYFIQMTNFLMGKCGLDKPIEIKKYNKMDCPCIIDNWDDDKKIKIKYNPKILNKQPLCYILNLILHEIGHLINKLPYNTDNEIINSEYEAEKFSLKFMKNHFPKEYEKQLKVIKSKGILYSLFKDRKYKNPYYFAYKKIKEYKLTISKKDLQLINNEGDD